MIIGFSIACHSDLLKTIRTSRSRVKPWEPGTLENRDKFGRGFVPFIQKPLAKSRKWLFLLMFLGFRGISSIFSEHRSRKCSDNGSEIPGICGQCSDNACQRVCANAIKKSSPVKPDARGYYTRQIGWKLSRTGKLQQHKFLLGKDRREAEIRERKLRELWDRYETTAGTSRPTWPDGLMVIAERVAKGSSEIVVQRLPGEMQSSYVNRILRMQSLYPVICFIAEDQAAFDVGRKLSKRFTVSLRLPLSLSLPFHRFQK